MRCLTLADSLHNAGVASHFICRAHSGHMASQIEARGHELSLLKAPHERKSSSDLQAGGDTAADLGADWTADADDCISRLREIRPGWLVVDHFAIDLRWERRVKQSCDLKIMVIDGLANRRHDCELLLDQTYSAEGEKRWQPLVPDHCQLLVGPRYALLRPEFREAALDLCRRATKPRRILVAFGGVDLPDATGRVLAAIAAVVDDAMRVDVVLGRNNPHNDRLQREYAASDWVDIHVEPGNLARLMANADIAIGAGGSMMWERCVLQLPTLIISIAENQEKLARELDSISAAVYLGAIDSVDSDMICAGLTALINDEKLIVKIHNVCADLMSQDVTPVTQYLVNKQACS